MCMELTYKDHIDHLPGAPADDFFFHRKDVTLSDQTLTNGVEAFWLSECVYVSTTHALVGKPSHNGHATGHGCTSKELLTQLLVVPDRPSALELFIRFSGLYSVWAASACSSVVSFGEWQEI